MARPLRFLWFGSYATGPGYPRSATLIAGLRSLGHSVEEVHAPLFEGAAERAATAKRGPAGIAWRQARAAASLGRRFFRAGEHDAAVVGYGGLVDVPLLRMLQGFDRIPVVWDAFVPLWDATVRDRRIVPERSWKARSLLGLERTCARLADVVLADTSEDADLLASDLGAERGRIAVVPVAQPDPGPPPPMRADGPLRCVLVASRLPLHGIDVVVEAARRLSGDGVGIEVLGAGEGLVDAPVPGLSIVPSFVPEAEVSARLHGAHVGLGVFGTTAKAARVVPLKAALTLAHGRCLVTRSGPAADRELSGAAAMVPAGDPDALASVLRRLGDDRAEVARLAAAGRERYLAAFTPEAAARALEAAVRPLVRP
ncbi:MAG: hypothetical protein HMLKMBBP_01804 [Planctomycetes bacterium]|nr:hypothetical protein [Planctomycetota bacterium]